MQIKEKIGLIGVGNMGSAILEGLLKNALVSHGQIWIYDKIQEKATEFAKEWKVRLASSNRELVESSDIVLLAVKPQDLKKTAEEFFASLRKSHVVISILAGMPVEKIRQALGKDVTLVRAMPNLGAKVGEAVTALTGTADHAISLAEMVFSGCGKTVRLEEKHFNVVTAISGSGPAYFFLLMEQLAEEGKRQGLSREDAELLAVQTAVGAGLLAREASASPGELRKMVTSKGGTTEAALKVLDKKSFPKVFREALEAARKRGEELSR